LSQLLLLMLCLSYTLCSCKYSS